MKYEVRCCCMPTKLLGWLEAPDDADSVVFAKAEPWNQRDASLFVEHITLPVATIRLQIDPFDWVEKDGVMMPPYKEYKAIKAEGVDIEILKKIPGFECNLK